MWGSHRRCLMVVDNRDSRTAFQVCTQKTFEKRIQVRGEKHMGVTAVMTPLFTISELL